MMLWSETRSPCVFRPGASLEALRSRGLLAEVAHVREVVVEDRLRDVEVAHRGVRALPGVELGQVPRSRARSVSRGFADLGYLRCV